MSATVSVKDGTYILIRVDGRLTMEGFQYAVDRALSIKQETGINKVLVDAREQVGVPGVGIDTFFAGSDLASRAKGIRFSVIRSEAVLKEFPQEIAFFFDVVNNRGVQIQHFADEPSALDWLLA